MKKLNFFTKFYSVVVIMIMIASCSNDDALVVVEDDNNPVLTDTDTDTDTNTNTDNGNNSTPPETLNIIENAQSMDNLSIFVEAITHAGLEDEFNAAGDKTILAPTNEALMKFIYGHPSGWDDITDIPSEEVRELLLYHTIPEKILLSTNLLGTKGYEQTLANGPNSSKLSIYINGTTNTGISFNSNFIYRPLIIEKDIETSNGIIHVVDDVVKIPTIFDFIVSNNQFDTLYSDAFRYSSDAAFPENSKPSEIIGFDDLSPTTLFAPTNDAFAKLLEELNVDKLDDIEASEIESILLNHMVSGNIQSSQLANGEVNTLNDNNKITINASTFSLVDGNDRNITIDANFVNIQAINGVIHMVDRVILPLQ